MVFSQEVEFHIARCDYGRSYRVKILALSSLALVGAVVAQ